jgi:hypothetical protein
MSIFHAIKKIPKEINLLILLKYGEPNHTNEYLNSLPDTVVDLAYEIIQPNWTRIPTTTQEHKKLMLSIFIRQPVNKPKAEKAIMESLVAYHSLLGTM